MGWAERARVGAALVIAVVLPGLANYALSSAGYEAVGTAVWFSGYLTAMAAIWYVWVRPIDFHEPSG